MICYGPGSALEWTLKPIWFSQSEEPSLNVPYATVARLDLLDHRFTAVRAVIVACQLAILARFQFLVRMFTARWITLVSFGWPPLFSLLA